MFAMFQVVALCEDQALQLPGYSDRHKGIHNVTISAKLVNEIFIPARYDVPYHPDTGLGTHSTIYIHLHFQCINLSYSL